MHSRSNELNSRRGTGVEAKGGHRVRDGRPRFVEGGVFATRQTQPVALYQSISGTELTLLPTSTNVGADSSPAAARKVSWLSALSSTRVTPKGSIALDDSGGIICS